MRSLIDVRPGEGRKTLLAMLFFFLVLASYYLIRPVRDQLSGANGLKDLPDFYSAVLVCMLLLTPVYGAMVARLPRARFIPLVYSFFILCLVGFGCWFIYGAPTKLLATSFFVWVSVFNLFVVAVFWSFMADLFNPEQTGRLFPLIAIGGSIGSLAGPLLTSSVVQLLGVGPLLLVGAGMLTAALLCALELLRGDRGGATRQAHAPQDLIGGSLLAGARLVFSNRVVGAMAGIMLLSTCIGGVLYALVAEHVRSLNLSAEARTALYSNLDLRINLIALGLQLVVARPLLKWLGAGRSFAFALSINVLMCLSLAIIGEPAFALLTLMVTRSCVYGLQKPLLEGFYSRVDRESRYKAKAFIDTAVWRFGDLSIVLGMNGLAASGLLVLSKLGVMSFGLFSATAGVCSGLLGFTVDRWTRKNSAAPAQTAKTEAAPQASG